jgi:hypothetical protein
MNVQYDNKMQSVIKQTPIEPMLKTLEDNLHTITAPTSFKEYATKLLGAKKYKAFVRIVGYTDFEYTDAYYAVKHYGFDDVYNHESNQKFYIDWDVLLQRLIDFIGNENILVGSDVIRVDNDTNTVIYRSKEQNMITVNVGEKIIVATTVSSLRRLLPDVSAFQYVEGQPFMYVYAKLSKDSTLQDYVQSYSVVHTPLQKVIPIDVNRNVFMISYVDNEMTQEIHAHAKRNDLDYFKHQLQTSYPKASIAISKIWKKYWKIGTHYFKPFFPQMKVEEILHDLQHPYSNILVVGESVSHHQGWVEGALQSVLRVLSIL